MSSRPVPAIGADQECTSKSCYVRFLAARPTRDERHGERSDEKQQGKEEAESRVEQEEERRRGGCGAGPGEARPQPLRQEGLTRLSWGGSTGSIRSPDGAKAK